MIQPYDANAKFFLLVSSLLLLVMVTYSSAIIKEGYAASNTHIVAVGDWGCSKNTAETVKRTQSLNPQLVLALGDYSYEKTATCWLDLIKPIAQITKINIGNHEDKKDGLLTYISNFGLSKPFYSYDMKNVHILTMSTEDKFDTKSEQYGFVVNDLRDAANNPDIKWIIVNMHYPFYASPNTCKESDCAGSEELRDIYHPLFDKYGVDLVLQGHVHNYQRSYPLNYNQESSSAPLATSTSKTDYQNPNGAIFAIVGTGGVNFHGLSGSAPFMAYQQDSKFGVLDISISDNKLGAKFVTNDGATLDHFNISKTAKKKIVERISDNMPTDPKTQGISYKDKDKSKPVIEKGLNGKPAITFKDENAIATTGKTKTMTDKKVQEDKPAIIFKDENAAVTTDKKDKPAIIFKDENAAVTTDKNQPKTQELKVQEDKSSMTSKRINEPYNEPPKDKQSMLVSKEKIEQADSTNNNNNNNKPSMDTQLSNDPPTDDKPISQTSQDKSDSSEQGKSTNDNQPAGGLGQRIVSTGHNDNNEFVDAVTDTDTGSNINTNDNDPFSPLK